MAAEDAEAPPPEEEAKKKEHEVSIVLSYMDDEHEKAAIEVRDGAGDDARSSPEGRPVPPPPTSARARNPHVPSHRSLLDAESFVRASDRPPPRASPPPPPPPLHPASPRRRRARRSTSTRSTRTSRRRSKKGTT